MAETLEMEATVLVGGGDAGGNCANGEAPEAGAAHPGSTQVGAGQQRDAGPGPAESPALPGEQDDPLVPFKRVRDLQSQSDRLRHQLAQRDEEVQILRDSIQNAAIKYRQALMSAFPVIPEQMLSGSTVDEVEESLERARTAVELVRQKLEEDMARSLSIPAGAPVRRGLDLSALSPREKIYHGLNGK
ncbi:MAG: hypothetical protein Q7R39_14720 [Dehalococcoidia bacterium]|nr:hypothetical protein [Dehalococcoidia bacterium]